MKKCFLLVFTVLLMGAYTVPSLAQQSRAAAADAPHVGLPIDWSSRHLVTPRTVDSNLETMAQHEPRVVFNWAYRNGGIGPRANRVFSRAGAKFVAPKSSSKADWSFTLGTGKVAFNMSPAKYSFLISGTADCVNDYMVMGLDVTASATQPNLVGFKNLYVNPAGTGSCAGTAPSIRFAYNVTTATGGKVLTSPALSIDGKKVAFVESATGAAYFHTLTIGSATEGSYSAGYSVVAPGAGGSNAVMTTTTISSSNTITNSSPWVDYSTDKGYVGDDAGNVYVINCVFGCAATQTATLLKNVGASTILTGPVLDNNSTTSANKLLVGGANGNIYTVDLTSCPSTCTVASATVGSATANGGVVDSPVLDGTFDVFFVGAGNNGAGKGVLKEYDSTLALKATLTVQAQTVDMHAPAFSDAYFGNALNQAAPPAGQIFACGSVTGSGQPGLYSIAFGPAAGTLSTANPPVLGATPTHINLPGNNNTPCSPMTELKNGATDRLFFSETVVPSNACTGGVTADGCAVSYTVVANTAGTAVNPTAGPTRSEIGGTSAIIIDNVLPAAEASSMYFSTQSSTTCGTGTGVCAVKLTQSALQ